jgi:hypothetical protein
MTLALTLLGGDFQACPWKPVSCTHQIVPTAQGHSLKLKAIDRPPKDIHVHLHWKGYPRELAIRMPFPASGGRAFDMDGRPVSNRSTLSLRQAAGIQILVFDQNPNRPKKYEIELELCGDHALCRSSARLSTKSVPISYGFAEVRLLDLYDEIETLLSLSGELDASVKLTLKGGGQASLSLSISRYDAPLLPNARTVRLSEKTIPSLDSNHVEGCKPLAIPLLSPSDDPLTLPAVSSEDKKTIGVWNTDAIDPTSGPWLIYPSADSPLQFRPLCINAKPQDDKAASTLEGEIGLASAMRHHDGQLRSQAIEAALERLRNNFSF